MSSATAVAATTTTAAAESTASMRGDSALSPAGLTAFAGFHCLAPALAADEESS
jgi:hypothetical protein